MIAFSESDSVIDIIICAISVHNEMCKESISVCLITKGRISAYENFWCNLVINECAPHVGYRWCRGFSGVGIRFGVWWEVVVEQSSVIKG